MEAWVYLIRKGDRQTFLSDYEFLGLSIPSPNHFNPSVIIIQTKLVKPRSPEKKIYATPNKSGSSNQLILPGPSSYSPDVKLKYSRVIYGKIDKVI